MSPLVPMSRSICCTDDPMPREVEGDGSLDASAAFESIDDIIPGRLQTIIAPSANTSCIASEGNFQSRTFLGRLLSCH